MKRALITGITGQDGSYLAELLLDKGYEVHGLIRRSSSFNTSRIEHLYEDRHSPEFRHNLHLYYSDLTDPLSLSHLLCRIDPVEVYNLGAQSHVGVSFQQPDYTTDVVALGTLRLLEAIKEHKIECRFYQASSSELFGQVQEIPQTETTPFYPRSPYAAAKAYAFYITRNYRESYSLFASNGILFNHESPRRGKTFVTRKISFGLTRIKLGHLDCLYLGNLDAKRDWGYAPDFVRGMYMILQHRAASDFVLATGKMYSVRDFVEASAECLGMRIYWEGSGLAEVGIDRVSGRVIVRIDKEYFRPSEVDMLIGDYTKARDELGWEPRVSFDELVSLMVKFDMDLLK